MITVLWAPTKVSDLDLIEHRQDRRRAVEMSRRVRVAGDVVEHMPCRCDKNRNCLCSRCTALAALMGDL